MSQDFLHLDIHTDYSLTDSLISVDSLINKGGGSGSFALAICDSVNLFGAIKFYTKCLSRGVKPIIGAELEVEYKSISGVVKLFCKNIEGYKNLIELISMSHTKYKKSTGKPVIPLDILCSKANNLLLLTGGVKGFLSEVTSECKSSEVNSIVDKLKLSFEDDVFFELQRIGYPNEDLVIEATVNLAVKKKCSVVATNAVRFINEGDFVTHEIRACVSKKMTLSEYRKKYPSEYTSQQYFKSYKEMSELFSDIEIAISNTIIIAKKCSLEIELGQVFLPEYDAGNGYTESEYLIRCAMDGLKYKFNVELIQDGASSEQNHQLLYDRLEYELSVINEMGFSGYFLIVADFIRWAKKSRIPVGPGRGSGAGSLVAYCLGITDINPIRYGLLFERFLNPERVSMPDFDIDFCPENRERVIAYVSRKYGSDAVSQIITFGTAAARGVLKDVSRVMGFPYSFGDRISKILPDDQGVTISNALEMSPDFKLLFETDPDVRAIISHGIKMEGLARQVGKHAGGVLIAPSKLTDFTPLYVDSESNSVVSQYDKDDVEKVGLVKFDFLGLRNLSIINETVENINKKNMLDGRSILDISKIDLEDAAAFDLLKSQNTTAVFQLESPGMKHLLSRLQPDSFEDYVALVALYRPGPLQSGMVDTFVNRKHEREKVDFPHERLKPVLENTYGVILYQEQVMQIAQVLAGYSLGQADLLRRAMGKKKPCEMLKQRNIFIKGAVEKGVNQGIAESIFNDMEKFAAYGFNKSHSAAYALISYQTAWLKTHHPAEYMAAVLSSDMSNTDKIVSTINDARKMSIDVMPPSINHSEARFKAVNTSKILYGLEGIKGIGPKVVGEILDERNKNGAYIDIIDFFSRCNVSVSNVKAGILSGLLDELGENRGQLLSVYKEAIETGKQIRKNSKMGQNDLFGSIKKINHCSDAKEIKEICEDRLLQGELSTLGLYLTAHPLDRYVDMVEKKKVKELEDISCNKNGYSNVNTFIMIIDIRIIKSKHGISCSITVDDKTSQMKIRLGSKQYSRYAHLLEVGKILIINGYSKYNASKDMVLFYPKSIQDIKEYWGENIRYLMIQAEGELSYSKMCSDILKVDGREPGPVAIVVNRDDRALVELPDSCSVLPSSDLINRLEELCSVSKCEIVFKGESSKLKITKLSGCPGISKIADREERESLAQKKISELLMNAKCVIEGS